MGHLRTLAFFLLTVAVAVVCLSPAALGQQPSMGHELRPGVVIDLPLGLAFAMSPGGGIDAIDLRDGNVRWHSDDADRPVAVSGGRLIAQATSTAPRELALMSFDAAGGGRLASGSFTLPEGTKAPVVDGLGTTFRIWAEGEGTPLRIGWEYSRTVVQGMATEGPPPEPKITSGALSFELSTGATTALGTPVPRLKQRYLADASERVPAADGRQFVSLDGNHVLISRRIADVSSWKQYSWTVVDRNGQELGSIERHNSYSPFVVTATVMVFATPPQARRVGDEIEEEPLSLRGVDIRSGIQQWSREIRGLEYQGPFPP